MQSQLILLNLVFGGRLGNPSRDFLPWRRRASRLVKEVALRLQEFDQEVVLVVFILIVESDLAHLTLLLRERTLEFNLLHDILEVLQVKAVLLRISDTA